MLRRLTLLVPPILFCVQITLICAALVIGHLMPASLSYFVWQSPTVSGYPHPIIMVTDGARTTPLVDLESKHYSLFAGPNNTLYAAKDGWLYRVANRLQPVRPLEAPIHDWVTLIHDGFIYSDGNNLKLVSWQSDEQITLTQAKRIAHHPTLSPDEDMLAYVNGLHPYVSDIMLMSLASRQPRRIAQGLMPEWSPDGKRLLYRDGDYVYHVYDLRTDRITDLPLAYVPHIVGFRVLWLADSLHLLYTEPNGVRLTLKTLNVETLATGQLSADGTHNTIPSLSPDGAWLAYSSDRDGDPSLFLLHLADRKTINTGVPVTWRARRLVWSPDRRYIAFSVNIQGCGQIVRYDVQTGRVQYGISADWYKGGVLWQTDTPPQTQTVLVY